MKKERMILEMLNSISDKFIDEAAPENASSIRKNKRIRQAVISSTAVAACFTCALTIGIGIHNMPPEPPIVVIDPLESGQIGIETDPISETTTPIETTTIETIHTEPLPYFDISDADMAMGFEGYRLYDISELMPGNGIECDFVDELSVYRNKLSYDERLKPSGQDLEKMESWLIETAQRLGMDTQSLRIKDNSPTEREREMLEKEFEARYQSAVPDYYFLPTMYSADDDNFFLEVNAEMTLTIGFKEPLSLPDKYNCISYANTNDINELTTYLWTEYGDTIGYESPEFFIQGGDYNIHKEQSYKLFVYDKKSYNIWTTIENLSLNYAEFGFSEGKLMQIRINAFSENLDKLANYPLIGREEAESRLLGGDYYSSFLEGVPEKQNIHRVEIVYRNGSNAKIIMPFYKFYVEMPEKKEDDLRFYGTFYVPAIDPPFDTQPGDQVQFNIG